jgi:aminoglycoside phosphotransferase (APT) family kinase protein
LLRFRVRGLRVAEVDPAAGTALVDLADRLAGTARDVPPGVVGLLHGDCKPSQFLIRDEEVVLLDLDSCGQGDPAGDVGTFLATLHQRTLRQVAAGRAAPAAVRAGDAVAELFLAAYLSAAGGSGQVDLRRRVTWYEAVAAERKALRTFYRAPRSPVTRVLVEHGHACLDRLEGAR